MVEQALEGIMGFLCGSAAKNLPTMQEMQLQSLGRQNHLKEGIAAHSSILAWGIPSPEDRGAWQATVHVVAELDTTW